jgi:tetratricopeptide (TPR) repeat protein
MRIQYLFLVATAAIAQSTSDRVMGALQDRALSEQVARLSTDDRIAMYSAMSQSKPDNAHYQVLLASAYVQKTRETTDYSYLDRAASLLGNALTSDGSNYEALRLMTETQLERHQFAEAAESSRRLIKIAPADPWNWGTLGDALIDMKLAIESGSSAPENVAWCLVDLGNIYLKTGKPVEAKKVFEQALRVFPNYHPAFAGLAKTSQDPKLAIEYYKRAQQITPMPDYAAALFDLYTKLGNSAEAAKQKEQIDMIDAVSKASGERANRNLVLIFADHGWKLGRALELARGELEFRRDVYSYDALAWALHKSGDLSGAKEAIEKALKLATPEPMFREHAKLILEAK